MTNLTEQLEASEKYIKHLEEKIKIYERKDRQATETSLAYEKLLEENAKLKERISKLEKMQYSYTPEEWNTMLRTVNRTSEQNAKLKELLKRAKMVLEDEGDYMIVQEINQVLGEE